MRLPRYNQSALEVDGKRRPDHANACLDRWQAAKLVEAGIMARFYGIANHHAQIVEMRMAGKSAKEIARAIGCKPGTVEQYASDQGLPRLMLDKRSHTRFLYGKVSIGNLTHAEIKALDRLALQIRADTLADAVRHLIRQYSEAQT
jgi:FixJ family two-component response regulator